MDMWTYYAKQSNMERELKWNYFVWLGISKATTQWAKLDDYLSKLIIEDFIDPKEYSKPLFDNESSPGREKYFWAIGCLVGDRCRRS